MSTEADCDKSAVTVPLTVRSEEVEFYLHRLTKGADTGVMQYGVFRLDVAAANPIREGHGRNDGDGSESNDG